MAGNIEDLHFEVILDDKKFSTQIEKDIELANKLNMSLSSMLNLKKKIDSNSQKGYLDEQKRAQAAAKTAEAIAKQQLAEQKVRTETEKTAAAAQKHHSAINATNTQLLTTSSMMRTLSQLTGITFSVAMVRRFLSSMIDITGQFELQKVALKTILRDAEGAERIFDQLYQFSSDSMYRFSELAKYAKQLAAFNIEKDSILDTTKMLGDVAAGLGVSMDRLILAYGHVKSSGFLRGIQLRSFSQNGVPILDELAKMMTEVEGRAVSLGEVFDRMTKRQIDFAMVEEAFRRMTAEGGQFHNIQEQMARTLAGEINVLKGRWENLMYAMGEKTEGFVLTIVRAISESISSLDEFEKTLGDLWAAGSPVWTLVRELRAAIAEARALKGKGSETSPPGGGGYAGGGEGGGSRGESPKEQEEIYLRIANIVDEIKNEEKEIYRLRQKAANEGLATGLTGGQNEVQMLQNAVDARDEALKQYKQITGEDYYKQRRSGAKTADQIRKERIRELKDEANYYKKLADAYEKLEPYLGSGTNAKMVEFFGKGDYSRGSLEAQINSITAALRELGDEGQEAAESIETSWSLDKVSQAVKQMEKDKKAVEEAQKSLNKYLDTLQNWADKNQEISGTGAAYEISKAIAAYKKAIAEANKTGKGAIGSLLAGTGSPEERMAGLANINAQWATASANALVTLRQTITKYADDIINEQMEGYDLTNWGDKSLSQLNKIKDAFANIELPDDVKAMLKDYPELLKALEDEIAKLKQAKIDKTIDPERWKKIAKQAKYIAERFLAVSESLKAFGDASGNQQLSDFAEGVSRVAQNIKSAKEGYEAFGGWWGAVIGGGSDLITQITDVATEGEKALSEFNEKLKEIQENARMSAYKAELNIADSIFGTNKMEQIRVAAEQMTDLLGEMNEILGQNIGTKKTTWWERFFATINNEKVQEFSEFSNIIKAMEKNGLAVYDENGILNKESIQALKDLYGDTDGKLQTLIDDIDLYYNALNLVKGAMEEVFGDIASQAADNIIDKWIEAGDAALDYADILDDVAKSYAKMLIESAILGKVLNKDEADKIADMFVNGRTDEAMSAIAGDMEKIAQMEPIFTQILSAFDPYFNRSESTGDGSLGSGIKSITEETAGLLASYINAIRADVSYIRVMQDRGWEHINAFGASLPTLNDHIAQIAANTYDAARRTESILSELRSVIGAPGTSGMVVRVEGY